MVVGGRPLDPVAGKEREVEGEGEWRAAGANALERALGEPNRRHPRRGAEALLGARVAVVDPPALRLELDPAQRGDAVGDEQRLARAQAGAEVLERLAHAGRGLSLDDRDGTRLGMSTDDLEQALLGDVIPRGDYDLDHARAVAGCDLGDPPAEVAGDTDDDRLARLDQPALAAVDGLEHADDLVENPDEVRIEVTEQRLAHRREHPLGRRWSARARRAGEPAGSEKRPRPPRHSSEHAARVNPAQGGLSRQSAVPAQRCQPRILTPAPRLAVTGAAKEGGCLTDRRACRSSRRP